MSWLYDFKKNWFKYNKGPVIKPITTYCFDYLEEEVLRWDKCNFPVTRDQLNLIPWGVLFYNDFDSDKGFYCIQKDHYGNDIEDINLWTEERGKFIDYLYKKYGK